MPIRVVEKTKAEMREDQSVKDKKKMLIGGQAKLDKNKNNKIDAEDFAMLRREKSPMKAKRGRLAGQDFSERMKNVERGLIDKKTGKPVSMDAMRQLKGFKTGELPKEFNKRRMALATAKEAAKASKFGKIALAIAATALAGKTAVEKMYEKRTGKKPFTKKLKGNSKGGLKAELNNTAKGYMTGGMAEYYKDLM